MTTEFDFEQLMRQADLLAIADRALDLGAQLLYEQLVEEAHAEKWDYEGIVRHLSDVRSKVPGLGEDIGKFLNGIPLTPVGFPPNPT